MDIAALKAAAEKATPGEWHEGDGWVFVPPADAANHPDHALRNVLRDVDEAHENARFIALANPSTILSLIARVEQMEEALRKASQLASIACDWHLEEVEIDGEMVDTHDLRDEFDAALETPANPIEEVANVQR
jgi:hypothetical protein